ncbi:peptide-N(4)-(N-acetyl-beta-glucosaminyl)asparagine amidase-like [Paramacrobiotus metropolitanus]|uniref:peptide-N(4)-(N-acetyl-beta- glucosaminyl)asparagine amidase-like n=1 Tax=Paramacrobiotus metropolitanus TaxID=2943436 RepID=UPI0024463E65|nr:peptide-N(4)-(N-acetyl-beta-glucosaminyl)asparagine amidase-like [Paramacrobiotus metropolitanus]
MNTWKKRLNFTSDISQDTESAPLPSTSTINPRNPRANRLLHQRSAEPHTECARLNQRSMSLSADPAMTTGLHPSLSALATSAMCLQRLIAAGSALMSVGKIVGNVIQPTRTEVACRKLHLVYSSRTDEYKRLTDASRHGIKGWKNLVYAEKNMELVTEHRYMAGSDVVRVFLARTPGSKSAFLQWNFDLSFTGMRIKRLMIRCQYEIFDDGAVSFYLTSDEHTSNQQIVLFGTSENLKCIPEAVGWSRFTLTAELSCRRGSCTFKHSQLCCQPQRTKLLESKASKFPMVVKIWFDHPSSPRV